MGATDITLLGAALQLQKLALKEQPWLVLLYCAAAGARVWGREATVVAKPLHV